VLMRLCRISGLGCQPVHCDTWVHVAVQEGIAVRTVLLRCVVAVFSAHAFAATSSIAPGVDVVFGTFAQNRQPDGNSVIFTAPDGLIVMDTGRHVEHTQQILDLAKQANRSIVAVINSHWHLDHIGGNPSIRAAYPGVRIYASGAIEGAMQGFLARYREDLETAVRKEPDISQADAMRGELAIIAAAPGSFPDERITRSEARSIGGLKLFVNLETYAVTAGDVWVFDPTTRVLAAGDLVTLPAPFLDTACPEGWKVALEHLASTKFEVLVPGHGAPMQRTGFETYRKAYGNLLECAASDRPNGDCVDEWIRDADSLIPAAEREHSRALMDYYMRNSLRGKPESVRKLCGM
jgi:glyoxylase-like metal-dependent hydrolase (beta-lactamase superfamily II)